MYIQTLLVCLCWHKLCIRLAVLCVGGYHRRALRQKGWGLQPEGINVCSSSPHPCLLCPPTLQPPFTMDVFHKLCKGLIHTYNYIRMRTLHWVKMQYWCVYDVNWCSVIWSVQLYTSHAVCPVKDVHRVHVVWCLPPLLHQYKWEWLEHTLVHTHPHTQHWVTLLNA